VGSAAVVFIIRDGMGAPPMSWAPAPHVRKQGAASEAANRNRRRLIMTIQAET